MIDLLIKLTLFFLLLLTPVARGAVGLRAFSVMELGVLAMIILWAVQNLIGRPPMEGFRQHRVPAVLLCLFVGLTFLQMVTLPAGVAEVISPGSYKLRTALQTSNVPVRAIPLSFFPLATKIELLKWVILGGFFLFLLSWRPFGEDDRLTRQLVALVLIIGAGESFYAIYELLGGGGDTSFALGTFINRNHMAGYLLMVIPLGVGFLFSEEGKGKYREADWRRRLPLLDGKYLLIGFGVIVMVLGLVLSGSRMGILSLLFSFTVITFVLRDPQKERRFSRKSLLLLGVAILWAAWIGLDAVISRFFDASEDFGRRWMIWTNTIEIVKEFPLFGAGLGTFTQVFPMHRSFHIRGMITHAENDFLQLAAEAGLIGAGLLMTLFIYLFAKAASGIRLRSGAEPQRTLAVGGMVGILAVMLQSLTERIIQVPANAFLYTLIWALVLRVTAKETRKSRS